MGRSEPTCSSVAPRSPDTTLAVSPDELWATVRDVGAVSETLDVITESSLNGDKRSCTMADGAHLDETIVCVDDDHRRVAYTVTASPFPIEAHAASMEVSDAGGGKSIIAAPGALSSAPVPDLAVEVHRGIARGEPTDAILT